MDIFSTYMYNEDWEREGGIRGRVGGGGGGMVCYFPNTTRSKVPAGDQK